MMEKALLLASCFVLYSNGSFVATLDHAGMEAHVYHSSSPYVVMLTSSIECEPCEAFKDIFEGAAEITGVANFAVVDMSEGDNAKSIPFSGMQVPEVRLYLDAGVKNAYKKNSWYRPFQVLTNIQSARSIRKAVIAHVTKDAPDVPRLSTQNISLYVDNVDIVAFSNKKEASPLMLSLVRSLQGSKVKLAQFPSFSKEDLAALKLIFQHLSEAPSLMLKLPSGEWEVMGPAKLKSARLSDLTEFIQKFIPLVEEEEISKPKPTSNRISSVDQFSKQVTRFKLPVIIAIHKNSDAELPEDWKKTKDKSPGVTLLTLDCEIPELKSKFPDQCSLDKWSLYMYEYTDDLSTRVGVPAHSLSEARSAALESIPDKVVPLGKGMINGFLGMSSQSKLIPIVLFGKQKSAPAMLTAVAATMEGLALVGYRSNPSVEEMQKEFGIPEDAAVLPIFLALLVEEGDKPGESRITIASYDRRVFGKFTSNSMISFVFKVIAGSEPENIKGWLSTHGAAVGIYASGEETTSEMPSVDDVDVAMLHVTTQEQWSTECTNTNRICVVGLFDGNPLNSDLESRQLVFEKARASILEESSAARSKLKFMWVDGSCEEAFTAGMKVEMLPSIVVYVPSKKIVFQLRGSFMQETITRFLSQIVAGYGKHSVTIEDTPVIASVDCTSTRQLVQDEDEDDQEWLREIKNEEAREKKEKMEAVKREMEILQQEEAAKNPTKKRRKRRKGKKKVEKDEL